MANVFEITAGALSAKLLTFKADWSNGVRIQHRYLSRVDDSESGKERRSPRRVSMILTQSFDMLMTEDEAEEMRNLIGGLEEDYLLAVPLWPDAWLNAEYESNRRYDTQYVANFTEGTGGAVYAADSIPGSPTYTELAPVMFGKLLVEPRFKAINETHGTLRLTIEEDCPYSHRIEPNEFTSDTDWPSTLVPSWVSNPVEVSKNQIRRIQVAEMRQKQIDGQEWSYRYERGAGFTLIEDDIGTLLDFWHTKQGRVTSFDAPAWFAPGDSTADAPHGFQSRFDSENLDFTYINRKAVNCQLRLVTLPWESSSSAEFEIQKKVRLFKFEYMSPTPVEWYYTDHEASLTNTESTWTPGPFEMVGSNARDLKLTHRPFKIQSHEFSGSPLMLFIPYQPDAQLKVTVKEAPLNDLEDTEIIHSGRINGVDARSRELTAHGSFLGGILDSPFPRFRQGHVCNWVFGSVPCGVNLNDHLETGTIDSISSDGLTVTLTTAAGDADGYFERGKLHISDGLTFERRNIIGSTLGSGTQILEIDRPLIHNGVSAAVDFWPGCDKRYTGGCTRYNNKDRFGNAPFTPEVNLAVQQPQIEGGGKK